MKKEDLLVLRFERQGRLGVKLILAKNPKNAKYVVVVEAVLESCPHKDSIKIGDILCQINKEDVHCVDETSFSALIARLTHRDEAVELSFFRIKNGRRPRIDEAALLEYEARAQADDGKAAYNASMLRANGLGARKEDVAAALLYLRKSAQLGVVRAQLQLARLYANGRGGVKKDIDEAFRWFSAAADAGDAEALYHLGHAYQFGLGTDCDLHQALFCFFRSAKLGHEKADLRARDLVASQTGGGTASWTSLLRDMPTHFHSTFQNLCNSSPSFHKSNNNPNDQSSGELNQPILIAPFSEALQATDDAADAFTLSSSKTEDGHKQIQPEDVTARSYQPPLLPPPPPAAIKSPTLVARNPFRDEHEEE
mmetsp:Transcript_16952/g.21967  ORF Transcript_16952/g.21967 Transcript_16952/m.21967 type:complete len:367 (+) Transcript_16952:55-1155(+)|eukprot:CAMPEP_0197291188 /NCGR_PEP_ID=MMETSP0890-20130614/11735_1 /TAXON_ID=44058 ORGANISM="Aureoumbra lagunensis, Strain CCMP1510" /NCGR_SAMPLE_ID=MMETSP0890 /ASSEMBLY_ACC=CAM_ASM_000533 /LENGTH=366 /DNA_ID=CAMNT_0042763821 /DNA_START=73 /DNA_END=1173 /DNA_ORIENTATION=-